MRVFKYIFILIFAVSCINQNKPNYESNKEYYPDNTKGGPMVFIPAGEFTKGRSINESVEKCFDILKYPQGSCHEIIFALDGPPQKVHLDAYFIDKYEVTRGDYKKCVRDRACRSVPFLVEEYENHPVDRVSYIDAVKYCKWAGKKLPTEAQWEKAARYTDERVFPWGDEYKCNHVIHFNCEWDVFKNVATREVGSLPKNVSPYGAYDMSGNVAEWTRDRFFTGVTRKGQKRESGFLSNLFGRYAVNRGGSIHSSVSRLFITNRAIAFEIDAKVEELGFRCVFEL